MAFLTEVIFGRIWMSKIFTHLAGGLNLSAGFSPILGASATAVPLPCALLKI